MSTRPVSLDHVNIFVRNAERSHRWYVDVLGLHTQDTFTAPETGRLRAAFLSADPDHAHDIALFEVGESAALPEKNQVGLNHVAWRMASLEDFGAMYQRLKDRGIATRVVDHTVSIGAYFADPDGNGLEVYYELPRAQWNQDRPFSEKGTKGRFPGPWEEAMPRPEPAAARA
jgi:catechol 2,3-dioxygenase